MNTTLLNKTGISYEQRTVTYDVSLDYKITQEAYEYYLNELKFLKYFECVTPDGSNPNELRIEILSYCFDNGNYTEALEKHTQLLETIKTKYNL